MDIFAQLAEKIIREQEGIIGPVALEQARKVPGLTYDEKKGEVMLKGNSTDILEKLVEKYKELFGQASVEVCKEASRKFLPEIPKEKIPRILQ